MAYDQTLPVPTNPQAQRQGTNAPAPVNPTPTTPFVQQPRAAENPNWQGPPTDSGLPQGRQQQLQPAAMGLPPRGPGPQPGRFPGQGPRGQGPIGQGRPGFPAGGGGYDRGAPLIPGDQNVRGVPGFNQPGPDYQGFGFGPGGDFRDQGEYGNAWGTPGGGDQGPGTMTLPGVGGYGGNAGGGGGGTGGGGGGGVPGDGGDGQLWQGGPGLYGGIWSAMTPEQQLEAEQMINANPQAASMAGGGEQSNELRRQIMWSVLNADNTYSNSPTDWGPYG